MKPDCVTWKVFMWVVGLLIMAIVSLWTYYVARGETLTVVREDLATIKSDVSWIKNTLRVNDEVAAR